MFPPCEPGTTTPAKVPPPLPALNNSAGGGKQLDPLPQGQDINMNSRLNENA